MAVVTELAITHTTAALYDIVRDRCHSHLVSMQGLERCPFLREVAEREGQQYAAHIACRPTVPFVRPAKPVLREDACDFAATFQLFHGPTGVVPLRSGILSGAWCVLLRSTWLCVGNGGCPRRSRFWLDLLHVAFVGKQVAAVRFTLPRPAPCLPVEPSPLLPCQRHIVKTLSPGGRSSSSVRSPAHLWRP